MQIEIKESPAGYWDLWVNGKLKVECESFAVVDGIRFALEHPNGADVWVMGELIECADSIRKAEGEAA